MLSQEFANHFADDWISSWNAHDLDRILSLYTDDFEMSSPFIAQLMGEPSGVLKGKAVVGNYWRVALERMPELRFELVSTLLGVDSLVLCYKAAKGMAAEVFFFNEQGKVVSAFAHYA